MGRWAQRRRAGGSNTSPATTVDVFLISAVITDPDTAQATWSAAVNPADFSAPDFGSQSSASIGIDVSAISPETLEIQFSDTITGDVTFEWNGVAAGVKSPDSVNY